MNAILVKKIYMGEPHLGLIQNMCEGLATKNKTKLSLALKPR